MLLMEARWRARSKVYKLGVIGSFGMTGLRGLKIVACDMVSIYRRLARASDAKFGALATVRLLAFSAAI